MSRFFGIIVLATVLFIPDHLYAQRGGHGGGFAGGGHGGGFGGGGHGGGGGFGRGGFAGGGFAGQSAPAIRGPVTSAPAFIGRPVAPFVSSPVGPAVFTGRPIVPFTHAPHVRIVRPGPTVIVPPVYGYGYGFYDPFFYGAPYSAPPVYSEPAYTTPAPQPPPTSQNELQLSYEVGRLTQEVEQLRQQQQQAQAPQPAPAAPVPTVLIFRDGHRMEIVNYAIVGQTLWVLDESKSVKISLDDLDLDATRRENRQRGVRFLLP